MDSPMPRDLTEEAVRGWLFDAYGTPGPAWINMARAVLALVEAKVREAITATRVQERRNDFTDDDEIVARVMGKEAPRV